MIDPQAVSSGNWNTSSIYLPTYLCGHIIDGQICTLKCRIQRRKHLKHSSFL